LIHKKWRQEKGVKRNKKKMIIYKNYDDTKNTNKYFNINKKLQIE